MSDFIKDTVEGYIERATAELFDRLNSWPQAAAEVELHEVVGALAARQAQLTFELACSPGMWNPHVAPLFLRAMCDVYITTAWILEADPRKRAREFILHGLGQIKLELEHRKANPTPTENELQFIDALEEFAQRQRHLFLTEVNVGSWSGKSTRAMAEESGCLDFYNYVYTPFSACVHSTWQHVSRFNLEPCGNPLHRLHNIPVVQHFLHPAPQDLWLAAKYLDKLFHLLDAKLTLNCTADSAILWLRDRLLEHFTNFTPDTDSDKVAP